MPKKLKTEDIITTKDHLHDIDYLAGRALMIFNDEYEGEADSWLDDIKDIQRKCSILLTRDFTRRAEARAARYANLTRKEE